MSVFISGLAVAFTGYFPLHKTSYYRHATVFLLRIAKSSFRQSWRSIQLKLQSTLFTQKNMMEKEESESGFKGRKTDIQSHYRLSLFSRFICLKDHFPMFCLGEVIRHLHRHISVVGEEVIF